MSRVRDIANLFSANTDAATDAEVTAAIASHNSATTSVHGISNTANLATTSSVSSSISTHAALTSTHGVTGAVVGTSDTQTLTNKTLSSPIFVGPEERWNVVAAAATGTINIDVLTAGVWYYTSNASANHTLNFRGNSGSTLNSILAVGDSVTAVWLNTNGGTAYYPSAFQVDGASVTPRWSGGTAPTAGNASSIDAYTFTIIKTASTPTYVVFAAGAVKY